MVFLMFLGLSKNVLEDIMTAPDTSLHRISPQQVTGQGTFNY